jgi:hypothetical protein
MRRFRAASNWLFVISLSFFPDGDGQSDRCWFFGICPQTSTARLGFLNLK